MNAAIARHGMQTLPELLLRTLHAVAFLHRRGVVHGDLKPDNLMLDRHGVVKIADLGLAGAEVGALTANTPHAYLDEIRTETNMIDTDQFNNVINMRYNIFNICNYHIIFFFIFNSL